MLCGMNKCKGVGGWWQVVGIRASLAAVSGSTRLAFFRLPRLLPSPEQLHCFEYNLADRQSKYEFPLLLANHSLSKGAECIRQDFFFHVPPQYSQARKPMLFEFGSSIHTFQIAGISWIVCSRVQQDPSHAPKQRGRDNL